MTNNKLENLNRHIQDFKVYDYALSDAEIKLLAGERSKWAALKEWLCEKARVFKGLWND